MAAQMKKLTIGLMVLTIVVLAAIGLYEFAKYPGEKHLMNTWKGK